MGRGGVQALRESDLPPDRWLELFRSRTTELARRLGDVLARVRYRHESLVLERNNG